MSSDICAAVARRLGMQSDQVRGALELLDQGLTACFIAHYRKSASGGADEEAVRAICEAATEARKLEKARAEARRLAEAAGALTEELDRAIRQASEIEVLDDIARPLKPGRRTAASVARDRGLQPLADYILAGAPEGPDLGEKAAEFVDHEKEIHKAEDALAGSEHILADQISGDWKLRRLVRRFVSEKGVLKSEQAKKPGKGAGEFRSYFQFQEPITHLPPHRVLAINRGERNKALKVSIDVPRDELLAEAMALVAPGEHRYAEFLKSTLAEAMGRLILPTIDREVRRDLTRKAEDHAIEVFQANLRSLLMAPPLAGRVILCLQPGFRSGCKVVVLDPAGRLLAETIVYPFEPQSKRDEAKAALLALVRDHAVACVAIGNGTGCRDCEELISELIEAHELSIEYTIVNEAGASIYADSDLAKHEFPNLDAAVRATVSIGRRLLDPLAELVKIDPRAIGVGLYQHDVNQDRLKQKLEATIRSCVCAVGVDLLEAPAPMFHYVPGLDEAKAKPVLDARNQGGIRRREDLRGLPGWDEQTFLQAAGFLRVRGENPLDATPIHPESYEKAAQLLERFGHRVLDLRDEEGRKAVEKALTGIALEPLVEEMSLALADLIDLVAALQHPDADPRTKQHGPIFRRRMRSIEDLQPGMWVKGTVRNVVDFGAFVDIGLKEDGLIHISQFSKRYVRNPLKFLHVGDVVEARVVTIDTQRHRIALSLIPVEEPKPQAPPRREAAGADASAAADRPAAPAEASAASPPSERGPAASGERGRGRGRGGGERRSGGRGRSREGAGAGRDGPGGAKGGRGGGRSRGPRRDAGDRRPRGDGKPRVHTFRDEKPAAESPTDEEGAPRIRWAWYEDEIKADQPPADEQ